jgi:hypothetical protein
VALLKETSKRKRNRKELEEVKEEESRMKENKQQYFHETKRLRREKELLADRVNELKKYEDIVHQLEEGGVIKLDEER